MRFVWKVMACGALSAVASIASAYTVDMNVVGADGVGKKVGTITVEQNKYGTIFVPNLAGLPPGIHGFHVHANPSCDTSTANGKSVAGGAAGGHWDPANTKAHMGPYNDSGHQGDLPALYVDAEGRATYPVLAPRIQQSDLAGHALMVHFGGDNHSDHPEPLGGGGLRIVCGVVK